MYHLTDLESVNYMMFCDYRNILHYYEGYLLCLTRSTTGVLKWQPVGQMQPANHLYLALKMYS